jgi:hypothetical protein
MDSGERFVGLRVAVRGCLVAVAVLGVLACSSSSDPTAPPPSSVTGTVGCANDPRGEEFTADLTHKGDSGALSFVLAASNFSPPAVDDNSWTIKVLDASSQPVKDAVLTFPVQPGAPSDPWMPDHSHGAHPAAAVNNHDGTYAVDPLYFSMAGIWSTYIEATSGSVTDSTTFTFCVE